MPFNVDVEERNISFVMYAKDLKSKAQPKQKKKFQFLLNIFCRFFLLLEVYTENISSMCLDLEFGSSE